jgi:hypothetical protein
MLQQSGLAYLPNSPANPLPDAKFRCRTTRQNRRQVIDNKKIFDPDRGVFRH